MMDSFDAAVRLLHLLSIFSVFPDQLISLQRAADLMRH